MPVGTPAAIGTGVTIGITPITVTGARAVTAQGPPITGAIHTAMAATTAAAMMVDITVVAMTAAITVVAAGKVPGRTARAMMGTINLHVTGISTVTGRRKQKLPMSGPTAGAGENRIARPTSMPFR